MPRTARHIVEFDVNGSKWRAVYVHMHFDPSQMVEGLHIRHLTAVRLNEEHIPPTYSCHCGEARCSAKDDYDWRFGVKLAFERALVMMGLATEMMVAGKITFTPLDRQRWGEFHHAFYTEMRNRSPQQTTIS